CQIRHVTGPCTRAEQLAAASRVAFPGYADWTPAADLIYMRFLLDLYKEDGNPRWYTVVARNVQRAGLLARSPDGLYFKRWGGERSPARLLQPDAATLALFAFFGGTPAPGSQAGNSPRIQTASSGSRR